MPEHVPDVSIVTPSLNQGRYIEQTLCSVLQQEGVRLQYIVVDGVSNDQTLEILERYRSRIDVLLIEKDDGQADAIRKGLSLATGTICAYLNSDDYLLPGALSRVATFFSENPGIDAVYSDRIFVDGDDRLLRYWRLPMHSNYVMCRWDFIPQETCFWRRSAMEEAGGIDAATRRRLAESELAEAGESQARRIGKTYRAFEAGGSFDGVFERSVDLVQGRFALIGRSKEFTLVPWRPEIEKYRGAALMVYRSGKGIEWTPGRARGIGW